MTTRCEEVHDLVRRTALDHLQVEVAKREDMFLPRVGCGEAELNQAAIAEWAWGLLERQREAITEAVMRAIDEHDNDDGKETA